MSFQWLFPAGVSAEKDWDMNSLCVPRVAKEAIGAICTLRSNDGACMTVNVEYNQLDPLLRSTIQPNGALLLCIHPTTVLLDNVLQKYNTNTVKFTILKGSKSLSLISVWFLSTQHTSSACQAQILKRRRIKELFFCLVQISFSTETGDRAPEVSTGDVNDSTGYSPFPGNINQLVIKLSTYEKQLSATQGVIAEFVNPKFKDSARTAFKKPTRLECMMQDFPKTLPPDSAVGFTTMAEVRTLYVSVQRNT